MKSQLDYAKKFAACEAEELRLTGQVQAGLSVAAISASGHISRTADLASMQASDLRRLADAPALREIGPRHTEIMGGDGNHWVRHTYGGTTILERPRNPRAGKPLPRIDWQAIKTISRGNLHKLCSTLCREAEELLGTDRAMVYRFHEDWSGEVLTESIAPGMDPFIGLHYPPTDIPAQARQLYTETLSRQIFAVNLCDALLVADLPGTPRVDLTHAIGRSVSPYHLEYLSNMGSAGTSSCALMVDGKLWGLLSLHYSQVRAPSLEEFAFLQDVAEGFNDALNYTQKMEFQYEQERQERLQREFRAGLETGLDPFYALMPSPTSPQRLIGAQGSTLLVEDEYCHIGDVPDFAVIDALIAQSGEALGAMETAAISRFDDTIPQEGRAGLAGATITKLADTPEAYLLTYRRALDQTVTWGGDPRAQGRADKDERVRVSPRKSFEAWVERVQGQAAPWSRQNLETIEKCLRTLAGYYDGSASDIVMAIRDGLRRTSKQYARARGNATELMDATKTAIAFCIETEGDTEGRILALNASASDAFSISAVEGRGLELSQFERLTGIDTHALSNEGGSDRLFTAKKGPREYDVSANRLFEHGQRGSDLPGLCLRVLEFHDVTEARRVRQALEAARDRARLDARLREENYAKLAHELRTPLNALLGISSLLAHDLEALPETHRSKIQMMLKASEHMTSLVNATFAHSTAAQTVDDESFEPLCLAGILEECGTWLEGQMQINNITFEVVNRTQARAVSDARAIKQVMLNILGNAVKYNVPHGHILASVTDESAFVCVRITDTGQGMTQVEARECMTAYKRFSGAEGAGLGLSIAQNLMSLMGGVISISSEKGVGTTVKLLVPKADADAKDWLIQKALAG